MRILVTGGAGFVGSNLAGKLLKEGHEVHVLDNLSRKGTEKNIEWLKSLNGNLSFTKGDIRNEETVSELVGDVDAVFHLAAQVAVTTSVVDPIDDFNINLKGTLNLLEAVRKNAPQAHFFYTSTNKVYGKMESTSVIEKDSRYQYENLPDGVAEDTPLDFYSPYGCSKGGADQYTIDYARIYGLKTTVFRMSCIYGDRQMGNEDQGWVAHFIIQGVKNNKITIYGDGKQVRDVLYISDLIDLFLTAMDNPHKVYGQAFNVGGGSDNTMSLLEFIKILNDSFSLGLTYDFDQWRPGDQKVYVSNTSKVKKTLGWSPQYSVERGVESLYHWIRANKSLLP